MNQGKKTVVPFERPAAYWAVRARRHYHPEQLPDAARFMRKALEKSGDTGLALELAQIYSAMGCYTAPFARGSPADCAISSPAAP